MKKSELIELIAKSDLPASVKGAASLGILTLTQAQIDQYLTPVLDRVQDAIKTKDFGKLRDILISVGLKPAMVDYAFSKYGILATSQTTE